MSIAECYSIAVTCDACLVTQELRRAEFTGKNATQAHRALKAAGWHVFPAQFKVKCPVCRLAKRGFREKS